MGRDRLGSEQRRTRRTVLVAGGANVFVGVVKLAAGIMSGSSAMLAEAAHSVADTLNQAFLLTSLHRGERSPDARHPFGYGQERYFWSLLSAFGIFVAGALFSVFEGLLSLTRDRSASSGTGLIVAFVALGLAGIAEGTSLARALWQVRRAARARGAGLASQLRDGPDTTVKTAVFEDATAVVGLVFAAFGLIMRLVTGSGVWDGAASIAIGGLLIVVAVRLALDSRDYLIGRSASPEEISAITDEIGHAPGVDALLDLRTLRLGPDQVMIAARVAFSDRISADQAEDVADAIDRRLSERLPVAVHVFLDPTQAG
jgi:cation diffusion facilitator family transporter